MVTNIFVLKTDGCEIHLGHSEDFQDNGLIGYLTVIWTEEVEHKKRTVGLNEDDLRILAANFLAFADLAKSKKMQQ